MWEVSGCHCHHVWATAEVALSQMPWHQPGTCIKPDSQGSAIDGVLQAGMRLKMHAPQRQSNPPTTSKGEKGEGSKQCTRRSTGTRELKDWRQSGLQGGFQSEASTIAHVTLLSQSAKDESHKDMWWGVSHPPKPQEEEEAWQELTQEVTSVRADTGHSISVYTFNKICMFTVFNKMHCVLLVHCLCCLLFFVVCHATGTAGIINHKLSYMVILHQTR